MTFTGKVEFRSSVGEASVGPPGESEVQRLNPARVTRILKVTGWPALAPGSLNLGVDNSVLDGLAQRKPVLIEPADEVIYPPAFAHIPRIRRAYWYYLGQVERNGVAESVL